MPFAVAIDQSVSPGSTVCGVAAEAAAPNTSHAIAADAARRTVLIWALLAGGTRPRLPGPASRCCKRARRYSELQDRCPQSGTPGTLCGEPGPGVGVWP